MFGGLIIIGTGILLGMISFTDDVIQGNKEKNFLRLFEAQYGTLMEFCVSLLGTKAKDWHFAEQLLLKKPLHPDLEIIYTDNVMDQKDRTLKMFLKKEKMFECRFRLKENTLTVRSKTNSEISLTLQDQVKLEQVINHLHNLYESFVKKQKEKEQVEEQQNRKKTIDEVLLFLDNEPQWNKESSSFSWTRDVNAHAITLSLHYKNEAQYICFYDKYNKKLHSKVLKTKKEDTFLELQTHLDDWCLRQINKRKL